MHEPEQPDHPGPGRPTAIAASAAAAAAVAGVPNRSQADLLRTVKMLMLFRVGLATLLLASAVVAELSRGTVEELAGPFARFGFGLIAATYFASLAYALLFPRVRDPIRFAYWQIAVDLALTTMVVHATGGGQSGFCFLYLIDVVAVALLARRRGAAVVAAAGITLMVGVAVLGWMHLLPLLPGQLVAPWHLSRGELAGKLTLNTAALIAVGFLASKLAAKNRQADERLTIHEAYAGDLARLHENTIRCLTSGLVTVDLAGRVTTANEVAREILGAGPQGLMGLPLTDVLPDLPRVLAAAGPAGTVRRAELSAATPDGSLRHLGVSAAPLSDHLGQLIGRVIHFQDLTELKRMELAVARSERLASIGRLSAAIAHEIRNPLASISGSMEILRDQPGTDPESRQLMNIAVREVDRLNALVTSLLDYARPSSEERRRVNLVEEAQEIVQAFERERRDERQADRRGVRSGQRSRDRSGGRPDSPDPLESAAQRRRGHAPGWHHQGAGYVRGRERPARSRAVRRPRPGCPRHPDGGRQWFGHSQGRSGPDLRTILLHQGRRNRAGPGHGGPHRGRSPRLNRGHQRRRHRHHSDHSSAQGRHGRAFLSGTRGVSARRPCLPVNGQAADTKARGPYLSGASKARSTATWSRGVSSNCCAES